MAALSNEERELLRSGLRAFLAEKSDERTVRATADTSEGVDLALWRELIQSLGIAGLLVPAEHGGLGLGYRDAVLLLEECARQLYSGPVLSSTVLAPTALLAAQDQEASARYFAAMLSGQVFAVAIDDAAGRVVRARRAAGGWQLSGTKSAVIDAAVAKVHLVVARDENDAIALFAVDPTTASVDIRALDVFDRTRRQAEVIFENAPAQRLCSDFSVGLTLLLDVGATAAAAEQLGVAQRSLEIAVDYAKLREQFGHPIGSFQAIKHLCAEMLTRVECLRSAVRAAAIALEAKPQERAETVSIAKAFGSEAASWVTTTTIQVLGGIGFTWDHPAHLYLRRAKSLQFAFGDAGHHRARIAALAGFAGSSGVAA